MTAAANRDRFRAIAHRYRSLPGAFGLRPYTVEIVLRTFSGTHTGEGVEVEETTDILESNGYSPKVRALSDEELALGGLAKGSLEIGPITPDYSAGGTSIATLTQIAATNGDMVLFRLTGPSGTADYRIVDVSDDRALHYTVRVKPVSE